MIPPDRLIEDLRWLDTSSPPQLDGWGRNRCKWAAERIEALEAALNAASDDLHRLMRTAEMSSGIMLDPKRTGNWPGARKTADAFDRIGLRAAEAKAKARSAIAGRAALEQDDA